MINFSFINFYKSNNNLDFRQNEYEWDEQDCIFMKNDWNFSLFIFTRSSKVNDVVPQGSDF